MNQELEDQKKKLHNDLTITTQRLHEASEKGDMFAVFDLAMKLNPLCKRFYALQKNYEKEATNQLRTEKAETECRRNVSGDPVITVAELRERMNALLLPLTTDK